MVWRFILISSMVLSLLAIMPTSPPAEAQSAAWTAQFYNNSVLADPVVVTQNVSVIAFDWGAGAPVAGVGADNFSARFSSVVNFPAGTYRFCVLADDSVNLWVGGVRIISSIGQNLAAQTLTADIALSGGNQNLQLDFQELAGNAYVYLTWTNLASSSSCNFPSASGGGSSSGGSGGPCSVQFYNTTDLSGPVIATTTANSPSANWGAGAPWAGVNADNFSARFTCQYTLTGNYEVRIQPDDGARVFVNGVNVIDRFGSFAAQTFTANVPLSGPNTVVVEYVEYVGDAYINFSLNPIGGGSSGGGTPSGGGSGSWTAQYYNNTSVAGSPVITVNEADPNRNWGTSAPINGIGADNFSVRWTTTQFLNAGTYRVSLAADDGVRFYVDGRLLVDRFGGSTGQTYIADVALAAGSHSLVIEYVEYGGNAAISYSFGAVGGTTTPTTGNSVTIATSVLNVRNAPNRFTGAVLVKVRRGEVYPAVGRNQDGSWIQINVNGTVGWVSASYVTANVGALTVVSTTANEVPAATGFSITTRVRVNMRGAPAFGTTIVAVFTPNSVAQVLGRSADNRWYKIVFNDVVGWVSADYVIPQQQFDFNRIPVMPI